MPRDLIVLQVLEILGGRGRGASGRVARMLGQKPATVYAWLRKGRIPLHWQPRLLDLARERGLPLEPKHFFYLDDEPPAGADGDPGDAPGAWAA